MVLAIPWYMRDRTSSTIQSLHRRQAPFSTSSLGPPSLLHSASADTSTRYTEFTLAMMSESMLPKFHRFDYGNDGGFRTVIALL